MQYHAMMAALDTLDPMIRGAAIALFSLWIAILLRDHRQSLSARVAIAMNLAIITYILAGLFSPAESGRFPYVIFNAVSVSVPVLFWLFSQLWFDDRRNVGPRNWILLSVFLMLPLIQIVLIATTGQLVWAIWLLVRIAMLGFALAGLWIAWRGRANDLIEARRGFRLTVIGAIGGFIVLVTLVEVLHTLRGVAELPQSGWQTVTITAIFLVTLIVSIGLYRFRSSALFAAADVPIQRNGLRVLPSDPSPLALRLQSVMADERAYRAEGFSIAALAARLGEPEYRVRRTINGEMGFRNFTAFLNSFRLQEVRGALADPEQIEVPILTIAIDAGFGSLGPFNRAFRDAEGVTPSEYRARTQPSAR